MSDIWLIIVLSAVLTYVTRIAGHLVIAQFGALPPRVEAALNAVLTTIVAPVFVTGDWPERVAIVVAAIASLRLPVIATVAVGTGIVVGARALGF